MASAGNELDASNTAPLEIAEAAAIEVALIAKDLQQLIDELRR